jgi:predicted extracellular nuclease
MNKSLSKSLSLTTILALVLTAVPMQSAKAVSTNIVISEFRVRGPNGGSDEFIELYNLSSSPVNIGGWKINGSNNAGSTSTRVTIMSGVILNPGCHYLVTNSSTSGGPYSGSVTGDQTYTTGITDDGGIALLNASNVIIDQVGMSAGSAYKEGAVLASLGSSNLNRGYERKPGGTSGSTQDTDNNTSDFQLVTPSDPQNLSSTCVPSTNPTGVGVALPSTVLAGQSALLKVTVAPGSNPTSTGLAVTGDLSSIGGSSTQPFFDDGTNGDATAGDNVFGFSATVVSGTTAGVKSLPFTVSDAQVRSSSGTISLTVVTNQAVSVNCDGPIITDVGTPDSATVAATDPDGRVVSISITGISPLPNPGSIFITNLVPASGIGGTASADVNVDASVPAGTYTVNITATNDDATPQSATCTLTVQAIAVTKIHDIQGSGDTVTPGTFTVDAIVVGDYQAQGSGQLRGFFLQEEDADVDANPATSEGIFVFCSSCPVAVSVGDRVRVNGTSSEFFGMSQLSATTVGSVSVQSSGNPLPMPASVQLPVPGVPSGNLATATAVINAYYEAVEGMLVTFPDTLSVSEYFELARYGQVILTEGGRPRQFTDANLPSTSGLIDHEINLATRTIILDDTDNRQNRPVDTPNTAYYHPVPGLSISNFFRGGDTITNLTGVLHWSFAGQTGTDAWRIRPVVEAGYSYAFTPVNMRPAVPNIGGSLKVASFNVLNYFLTVDTTASNSVGSCGASGTLDCRGADSTAERDRQQAKLTEALKGLDADVVGLIELENTPNVDPLAEIVSDLNTATASGTYAAINTDVVGTDAIKVGLIYKPSKVTPVGTPMIDNNPVFSRPPVAQFFETTDGARFTVVINHFKSKGCDGATGADLDQLDGQGCFNNQRRNQAAALVDFVNNIVSQTGDPDVLIIGDLNSYAKENPIVDLENAGYTNLVATLGGPGAYSYVFDSQLGYLDHALSTPSLTQQVTGVADWHINTDEIPLFDYNDDVKDTGEATFEEESDVLPLYQANEFRTSDHDPVVIGLNPINYPPTADAGGPYSVVEGGSVTLSATGQDPEGAAVTFDWDLDNNGTFETPGQSVNFSAASITAPATLTVKVKVTDAFGNFTVDEATVYVLYNFNGFFQPVDNLPVFNSVKAGQAIPVKFSLNGNHGLSIFAAGYPKSETIACSSTNPVDGVEETVTAGSSSLSYDPLTDTYIYVWKTDKAWGNTCRQLVVKLNDGTFHRANFKFTK